MSRQRWRFTFPFLPPGVNHQYVTLPRGRKALSPETRGVRENIEWAMKEARFEPNLRKRYGVAVTFYFPTDGHDIDGPIKPLLDAIFGTRRDHRIYHLDITKVVEKRAARTEVEVWEQLS